MLLDIKDCSECGRTKTYTSPNGQAQWYYRNGKRVCASCYCRENMKKYRETHEHHNIGRLRRAREILFDVLGRKCSSDKCAVPGGMTDIRALQFDHINGGGLQEIKKWGSNPAMMKYYADNPTEATKHLQVLCANCNWIKRREKDENPFRERRQNKKY